MAFLCLTIEYVINLCFLVYEALKMLFMFNQPVFLKT